MTLKQVLKPIYCSIYVLTAVFGSLPSPSSASPVNYTSYAVTESYLSRTFEKKLKAKIVELQEGSFLPLSELPASEEYRPLDFLILEREVDNGPTQKFLETLVQEKSNLMALYSIDNARYNEFSQMAVGILGNESKFFNSPKYQLKAAVPDPLVYALKGIYSALNGKTSVTPLSHGPTFIKEVPEVIAEFYDIQSAEELDDPFKAAVATIGYLATTYYELLYKIDYYKMDCVNEKNFSDMLLYLYFGSASYRRDLIQCNVNPDINIYVKNYREYRKKVQWFEQAAY